MMKVKICETQMRVTLPLEGPIWKESKDVEIEALEGKKAVLKSMEMNEIR